MIDPHVLHGGASSWFWIAAWAKSLAFLPTSAECEATGAAFGSGLVVTIGSVALPAPSEVEGPAAGCRLPASGSSFRFTPTRNCASGDRNFVAIHRKM